MLLEKGCFYNGFAQKLLFGVFNIFERGVFYDVVAQKIIFRCFWKRGVFIMDLPKNVCWPF
jgi:hypothetical protein